MKNIAFLCTLLQRWMVKHAFNDCLQGCKARSQCNRQKNKNCIIVSSPNNAWMNTELTQVSVNNVLG